MKVPTVSLKTAIFCILNFGYQYNLQSKVPSLPAFYTQTLHNIKRAYQRIVKQSEILNYRVATLHKNKAQMDVKKVFGPFFVPLFVQMDLVILFTQYNRRFFRLSKMIIKNNVNRITLLLFIKNSMYTHKGVKESVSEGRRYLNALKKTLILPKTHIINVIVFLYCYY